MILTGLFVFINLLFISSYFHSSSCTSLAVCQFSYLHVLIVIHFNNIYWCWLVPFYLARCSHICQSDSSLFLVWIFLSCKVLTKKTGKNMTAALIGLQNFTLLSLSFHAESGWWKSSTDLDILKTDYNSSAILIWEKNNTEAS